MRNLIFIFLFAFSLVAGAEESAVTAPIQTEPLSVEVAPSTPAPKADAAAPVKIDTRKESEIALNLDSAKKAAGNDSPVFRILFSISMVGILGLGAFVFLRKYAVPKGMKTQTQIKILQQHYLGPKKSLAIVRVAGESILIGVTDHNISMIKSLSLLDDEVPEEAPARFANVFGSAQASLEINGGEPDEGEDFSFGGIKDIVAKRLKGMRNLE